MVKRKKKLDSMNFVDIIILIILGLVSAAMLYPVINVLAISLSDYSQAIRYPWMIFPRKVNFIGYNYVFNDSHFWRSYLNSIIITAGTTLIGLSVTILTAWPLARKELKGKPIFMGFIIFTMVFSAGMIPNYLNIKGLNMLDTFWAVILPSCFSAFNCIVMINFFRQLPYELVESATIDGASEPYILTRIIIPLSKPVIASISLFLAVSAWNSYFNAQVYLREAELWPMALTLKELLTQATTALMEAADDPGVMDSLANPKTIQYASVIIATVPIMCVYPFLQKYFAKGVMVGSVKG